MSEEWRSVLGYEGIYEVSSTGRVRSLTKYVKHPRRGRRRVAGRILSPGVSGNGYLRLRLCHLGREQQVSVHRLVAEAFLFQPRGRYEVNHLNGLKTDNRVANLEWCSSSENQLHAYRVGTQCVHRPAGESNGNAKLDAGKVKEIRRLYRTGAWTHAALGHAFGVAEQTIGHVISRYRWGHVT